MHYCNSDEHKANAKAARELALAAVRLKKLQRLALYDANPTRCKHCNSALPYVKRWNEFCSKSCSASFNNQQRVMSEATKQKIAATAKANASQRKSTTAPTELGIKHYLDVRLKVCKVCGKEYHPRRGRYNQSIVCGTECRIAYNRLPERVEHFRQKAIERVNNGTHKGWHSRANRAPSYPERYFIDVFTNEGIEFEREVKCGRFFIDFVVGDLAIEIDGAQHEYPEYQERDRRKDEYLTSNGYQVIRIKWYNPSNPVKRERLYTQIKELKLAIMQQKQRCRDESLDV